jgi:quinol monooxygenase YgiN
VSGRLIVVATLRAAPGKGDELAAFLAEQCKVVRDSEPGCVAYRLHRARDDPSLFLFYEAYVDDAAFEAHRASAHLASFRKRRDALGLTDGPAQVTIYRALTD